MTTSFYILITIANVEKQCQFFHYNSGWELFVHLSSSKNSISHKVTGLFYRSVLKECLKSWPIETFSDLNKISRLMMVPYFSPTIEIKTRQNWFGGPSFSAFNCIQGTISCPHTLLLLKTGGNLASFPLKGPRTSIDKIILRLKTRCCNERKIRPQMKNRSFPDLLWSRISLISTRAKSLRIGHNHVF